MIKRIFKWIISGPLDRILDSIDNKVDGETKRQEIKADVIKAAAVSHMQTRAGWLKAGGFWLLASFGAVVLFHFGSVVAYSIFWCEGCAYPKPWTIAALPPPMNEWEGWIILACIGGLSLFSVRK